MKNVLKTFIFAIIIASGLIACQTDEVAPTPVYQQMAVEDTTGTSPDGGGGDDEEPIIQD